MFIDFFYMLRRHEVEVSLGEWMTFLAALDKGLAESSLTGFYRLGRTILVKSEADYDNYDTAFLAFFKAVLSNEGLQEALLHVLYGHSTAEDREGGGRFQNQLDALWASLFAELLHNSDAADGEGRNGEGAQGQQGMGARGAFGMGSGAGGIRPEAGEHGTGTALHIASEHRFKDFREDTILGIYQFQMALRRLRSHARVKQEKTELNVDETVRQTGDNAGRLTLVWEPPRKNAVKLLLLIDSGGSMDPYAKLCNQLFQAVSRSNHYQDLKIYYFHNTIYDVLYHTPFCRGTDRVETDWFLRTYDGEYRLILVGDADMSNTELLQQNGNIYFHNRNDIPSVVWLERLRRTYRHNIWLNPLPQTNWHTTETVRIVETYFPMFELSLRGLDKGIKQLMSRRAATVKPVPEQYRPWRYRGY